jgi:predicted nucleic acid-binding protein
MYILDTDILTHFWRGNEKVASRIRGLDSMSPAIITVINYIEVLQGRFDSIIKAADSAELLLAAERLDKTVRELAKFHALKVDESVAAKFDELRRWKRVKKMGRADLLIACFALVHDATLVTRNTKGFAHVPGLKLENWAD